MAVRNQYSHLPGYGEPPPRARVGGPRARQPMGDTLILTLLFIIAPLCGLLGFFINGFLWAFIIVSVMSLLCMWALRCFEPKGRAFISGVLVVLVLLAVIRVVSAGPPTRGGGGGGQLFPVLGSDPANNLQAQGLATTTPPITIQQNTGEGSPETGIDMSSVLTEATAPPEPTATRDPSRAVAVTMPPLIASAAETPPPQQPSTEVQLLSTGVTVAEATGTEPATNAPRTESEAAAAQTLDNFLQMWRNQDFDSMVQYTSAAWQSTIDMSPTMQLRFSYSRWIPQSWAISVANTSYENVIALTLDAKFVKSTYDKTDASGVYTVSMYFEGGQWKVDPDTMSNSPVPISLQQQQAEEEAAAQSASANSSDSTSASPTTDPSTKLWYNPDGGKYYHARQDCTEVRADYHKNMKSFEYSELKTTKPYKSLSRCTTCKAPR